MSPYFLSIATDNLTESQSECFTCYNIAKLALLGTICFVSNHFVNNIITLLDSHTKSNQKKTEIGVDKTSIYSIMPVVLLNALPLVTFLGPIIFSANLYTCALVATTSLIAEMNFRQALGLNKNELNNLSNLYNQLSNYKDIITPILFQHIIHRDQEVLPQLQSFQRR
jgi:hypothetical protein